MPADEVTPCRRTRPAFYPARPAPHAPPPPRSRARPPARQSFYDDLAAGIAKGGMNEGVTKGGRLVIKCATVPGPAEGDKRRLAGAIVLHTLSLAAMAEAKTKEEGKPMLSFDLLDKPYPGSQGAYVLALGVLPKYRRNHIASDLLHRGVQDALTEAKVQVVFLHAPRGNDVVDTLFDGMSFVRFGYVPGFYAAAGGKADASLWAAPFHHGQLASYAPQVKGEELNLAGEMKRAKRAPKWVTDCALQFGLPICIVALLFVISYVLVLLGPLRGISNKYMDNGAAPYEGVDVSEYEEGGDDL
jgi:ribosomal protein S18 acetylase RimI-like enzyme